ncbi:hypothetical protein K435DRAFT_876550 [Dendrothele bispora CBS 962.96]|uniref:Uncharacterized protein n=1 Tax=Dendrothele bispora (strain CBS 962.96) TaxID=1314807 RepID=A0A4S8KRT8_DENBC|nr:hypothetical protein K435DRAFT_876550 [Dendrothele bispora CBS 962.96]
MREEGEGEMEAATERHGCRLVYGEGRHSRGVHTERGDVRAVHLAFIAGAIVIKLLLLDIYIDKRTKTQKGVSVASFSITAPDIYLWPPMGFFFNWEFFLPFLPFLSVEVVWANSDPGSSGTGGDWKQKGEAISSRGRVVGNRISRDRWSTSVVHVTERNDEGVGEVGNEALKAGLHPHIFAFSSASYHLNGVGLPGCFRRKLGRPYTFLSNNLYPALPNILFLYKSLQ